MSGLSGVERSGAGPSMVAPATDSAPAILDHSISAEIVAAAAAIEGEWRALADRAKVPVYQRYDWVDAFLRTVAAAQEIAPAILRIRVGGRTAAILPLGIERRGPLRIARMLGGGHANIRMPIVDPDAADALADPAQLAEVVIAALRHAGRRVDLLDLDALPLSWNGCIVPLATHPAARPARLPVGHMALGADLAATLDSRRRSKRAKKHRAQLNALAPVGGYRFRRAADAGEARAIFARFRAEKAEWFARMGICDPFAEPGAADFFDALIQRRWQNGEPLIELFAIEFDGDIRAIFGSGAGGGRMSGYFLSVADDEWRRITPGELLLHDVIADCCAVGYESFDLGRGDERYKWSWLERDEPQVRLILPVSPAGGLALALMRLADTAERQLRRDERLWRLAQGVRRRLAGRRPPQADEPEAD